MKYAEAILSNSSRRLLWFEITKMLTTAKNKFTVLFVIIFSTLSSTIANDVMLDEVVNMHHLFENRFPVILKFPETCFRQIVHYRSLHNF